MSITASAAAALNVSSVSTPVVVSDSAANVATYLDQLHTLATASKLASITLTGTGTQSVTITVAKLINDANALLLISNASWTITLTGIATVAQAVAANSTLITKLTTGFAISDTAANVTSNLTALQARSGSIASIVLTGTSPILSITAAALVADTVVLGKITTSAYSITIASGTVTAAQAVALSSALVSHVTGGVAVSDTAANVSSRIDSLQARVATIKSITLTDGSPVLALTATQLTANSAMLLKIGGAYAITVSGTATAAQVAAVKSTLITKLTTGLAVSDTAANIASNITALHAYVSSIASIALTDASPVVTLTAAQLVANASLLLKITGSYSIALSGTATAAQVLGANSTLVGKLSAGFAVSDTAANVSGSLDALQARAGTIASIALTDGSPVVTLTAAQLLSDSAVLLKIGGAYGITVSGTVTAVQAATVQLPLVPKLATGLVVSDTAAAVVTNLAGLQARSSGIASIALTDGSPVLSLTTAQFIADTTVLLLITGSYSISLSTTSTVAQAIGANTSLLAKVVSGLAMSDTAANVASGLDALQARTGTIASIVLTDGSPVLSLAGGQLIADASVLLKISSAYHIALSGTVTAAQAIGANATLVTKLTTGLVVSDTAANVATNLDALRALGTAIAAIGLTDVSPVLTLTAAKLISDLAALQLIGGNYGIALSGSATVAQALGVNGTLLAKLTAGFAVSDTAATVASNLGALQTLAVGSKLASISLTDIGTPTITVTSTTLVADAGALAVISSVYTLVVSSGTVTVAQALALSPNITAMLAPGLAVSDSAANVYGGLTALEGLGNRLGSVVVTGGATAAVAVAIAGGLSSHVSGTIAVGDAGANVVASLGGLFTNLAKIGTITLSDSGTALIVTSAAVAADGAVFGKIAAYSLTVSDTITAAVAGTIATGYGSHLAAGGLTVADTAANVSGVLSTLQTLGPKLNSVAVTDAATATVAIAIAAGLSSYLSRTVGVSDAGVNIVSSLDGLLTNLAKIGVIRVSNVSTPLSVGAAALSADSAVFAKIVSYTLTVSGTVSAATAASIYAGYRIHLITGGVAVSDTAAAISGSVSALQALGGLLGTVTISDTPTAAQAATIAAGLSSHLTGSIAVADTGAAIVTGLGGLLANIGNIGTITVSDVGTPLSVGAAALSADSAVFAKIVSYTLTVSGTVSAATAATIYAGYSAHLVTGGVVVSDTAAAISGSVSALQALGSVLGTVTISDTSTAAQAATIAAGLSSHLAGLIVVSDTGAAIITGLGGLLAKIGNIGTITVSNVGTPLSVGAAALSADSAVFAKIVSYTLTVSGTVSAATAATIYAGYSAHLVTGGVVVSDTAAAISGSVSALQALGGLLGSVTISDTSTAAQAATIAAGLSSHLAGAIAVSDTGAAIVTGLGGLLANIGNIGSITVSDVGTPLSVGAAALGADSAVFAKIVSYTLTVSETVSAANAASIYAGYNAHLVTGGVVVSDTSANVFGTLATLEALGGKLNTVTVTGTAMAAQAAAIAAGLSSYVAGTIAVSDTGANIVSNLSGLLTNVAKIGTIVVSDVGTPLLVTSAALAADNAVFGKIASYTVTVSDTVGTATVDSINTGYGSQLATAALTVSDTAANVSADVSTLTALGGKLNTVTVTGTATAAQAVAIGGGLTSHVAGTIAVSDTGTNIVTSLAGLLTSGAKIGTIAVSDVGTPLLVTSAALAADSAVFGKIASYTATVSDTVGTATVDSISTGYGSHLATAALTVSDTAANVSADLSTLTALSGKLNTVTVTGTATAAQAVAIAGGLTSHVAGTIAVSDTGANVVFNLSGLLANVAKIGTIVVSDVGTPLLVSSAALAADSAVFGKIASYTVTVSDTVGTATVDSINTGYGSHLATAALTVSDTAANVSADVSTLTALGGKLNTVTVTGTATAAQAVTIAGGLTSHVAGTIAVSDTGANIVTSLAGLLTSGAKIGTIAVSDVGTPLLVTSAALAANSAVFGKIASYTVTVSDTVGTATVDSISTGYRSQLATAALTVSDTAANVSADVSTLTALSGKLNTVTVTGTATAAQAVAIAGGLTSHVAGTIAVSDTGANVVFNLSGLLANVAKIGTIVVSDVGTPLLVSSAALAADSAVFGKIASYTVTVSDTVATATVDSISTGYGSHLATAALTVSDTAANVSADLSTLTALAGKLNTVTVTGAATAAQAVAIAGGLPSHVAGTIAVSDTGANIVSNLSGLLTNVAKVGAIVVSDVGTPLLVSSAALAADSAVFGKIASYTVTVSDTVATATVDSISTGYGSQLATAALTVSDTAANVFADLSTLTALGGKLNTVTVTGTATAAQAVAIAGGLPSHVAGTIAVSDTGANVVTSLGGLFTNQASIGTITISDIGTPLLVSSTVLLADGAVLALAGNYTLSISDSITAATASTINTGYGSHLVNAALTVSDTATGVYAALSALEALGAKLGSVTVTGSATAAQAVAIAAGLTTHISGTIAVGDTGANVVANIGGLFSNLAYIGVITLSDANTPLVVTSTMLNTDSMVFGKIGTYTVVVSDTITTATMDTINNNYGPYRAVGAITVSDTAANVAGDLSALQDLGTRLHSVTVTGAATVSQATTIAAALSPYISGTIAVSDTGANVVAGLSTLLTNATKIGAITLTDGGTPTMTVTAATLVADAGALAAITSAYSLVVSSGTVTAAQAVALNATVASHLSAGLAISDTAANVSSNLAALQALGSTVASIALTDGSPVVTLTAAQLIADSAVLLKIGGSYVLNVSSGTMTATQAIALSPSITGNLSAGLAVSDASTAIASNLDALQSMGATIASIALTDVSAAITLTPAQLIADAAALLKITNAFGLTLSGAATAAQAAGANSTLAAKLTASITVSDTAANVTTNLSGLQTRATASKLGSITLTNGGTPALSINSGTLTADAGALLAIVSSYTLTVSGTVTVANALELNTTVAGKVTGGLAISSSAALFSSNLNALQAIVGNIGSVALTGGSPLVSLTATQLISDSALLLKIGGTYHIAVSGTTTAAQAAGANSTLVANLNAGLTVSDTAANVTTYLDGLQTVAAGSKLGSITLTDGETPVLTISAAALVADNSALATISGLYALSVSGTVTAAQAVGISLSVASHVTGGLIVSDTAANVSTYLAQLESAVGNIASISLTDSGTPALSISATALIADASALALITSPYTLTISGSVTVANILALNASVAAKVTGGLTVGDTSTAVHGGLDALQALGATVGSVVLSGSPATFSVTATQLAQDGGILTKIINGSSVTLTADTVTTSLASAAAGLSGAPPFTGQLVFEDTAANVSTYLSALQTLATAGNLGTILLSDSSPPTLSITATQLLSDSGVLAAIGSSYSLTIASGTLTAAQAIAISPSILTHISAGLPVLDTSANIVSNLDALQTIASSIRSVAFSNGTPTLSLTTAKIISDINALSLATGYTLAVTGGSFNAAQAATLSTTSVPTHLTSGAVVSDTAANISAALASLVTLANVGKLGPITLTDVSVLPVTPAQLLADLSVFRKITNNYTFSVSSPLTASQAAGISALLTSRLPANLAVADSAANVIDDLDILEGLALGTHLGSVTLTDSGTPVLQLTADQLTSDAAVLADIVAPYQLLISGGITAAQATYYTTHLSELGGAVSVVDSAANILAALTGLATLAGSSLLSSITFTDTGTPNLALSAAAFVSGMPALPTIVGAYSVSIASGTLTAAQIDAAGTQGLLGFVSGTINVGDTGADVVSALAGLLTNVGKIGAITLSDSGVPLVVTSAQLGTDGAVFAKIASYTATVSDTIATTSADSINTSYGAHLAVGALTVSDTAAAVNSDLATLEGLGSKLNSVAITGAATAAQAVAVAAGLTSYVAGTINVSDTGADVVSALAGLLTNIAKIGGITVSDSDTPLVVTSAQLAADVAVFAKIASYTATVSDTIGTATVNSINTGYGTHLAAGALTVSDIAANVNGALATLGGLGSKLNSVAITDGATAAQAVAIAAGLSAHISGTIAITDAGANVVSALAGLQTNVARIGVITVSDSGTPLVVTSAQLASDGAVFAKIASYTATVSDTVATAAVDSINTGYGTHLAAAALTVSDTAAAVNGDLGTLEGLGSKLNSVAITGTATAAQAVAVAAGLTSYVAGTINVSDTGGNMVSALAGLLTNIAKIGGITVSDSDTPLVVTSAQLATDGTVLAKITTYTATVSDTIATATVDSINSGYSTHLAAGALTVSDIAANVNGDLATLEGLGSKLNSVAVTDSATAAQAVAITAGLSDYVAGTIAVSDTGSNVLSALAGLLTNVGKIGAITVSDSGTPLVVTSTTLSTDAAVFAKIGTYTVTVSDTVAVAAVDSIDTGYGTHLAAGSLTVSDIAANVNGDLATLEGLGSALNTVAITGTATAAQAVAIAAGLSGHLTGVINVSDVGTGIVAALPGLLTNLAAIGTITVSNSDLPLVVTSAQLSADGTVFAKITSYTATVSDTIAVATVDNINTGYGSQLATGALTVSDTAANVDGDLGTLEGLGSKLNSVAVSDNATAAQAVAIAAGLSGFIPGVIAVVDSGANVLSNLSGLRTNIAKIGSIGISDGGTPLTVSSTTLSVNGAVFAAITNYSLRVSNSLATATVDSINTVYGTRLATGALHVSDTAAHVFGDLTTLMALGNKLNSVVVTSEATAAQAVAITGGLLAYISGIVTVTDVGSAIVSALAGLLTNIDTINTITISDSATPLVVTSAELATYGAVFDAIISYTATVSDTISTATVDSINASYSANLATGALTVSDTANHVNADLVTLEALGSTLNSVAVTGTATATQAVAIAAGLSGYVAGTIAVSDTGANIVSNLSGLLTNVGTIGAITVSDSGTPMVVTSTTLSTDSTVFAKIGTYTVTVSDTIAIAAVDSINTSYRSHLATGALTVSDTAANVIGDLSTLEELGSKLNTVAITGTATAAQAVTIAVGLSSYVTGVINVSDVGTGIVAALAGLLTNIAKIGTITVSNSGTPLVVTSAQFGADGAVFSDIVAYTATVSDTIATATVNSINTTYGTHLASSALTVSDSVANVYGDLATLQGLGSKLNTVTVTGTATATQAAAIATDLGSHITGQIAVTDSASKMMTNIDALQTLVNDNALGALNISTPAPAVTATVAQVNNDSAAINDVMGAPGANANAVLYVQGTGSADTIDASSLAHVTDISLGLNGATMSYSASAVTVTGATDSVTLGSTASTVEYTALSGTEVITGFQFGIDVLNMSLNAFTLADLHVDDVTVNGVNALAVTFQGHNDTGVLLMNTGMSASTVLADHVFAAGNHMLVS